MLQIKKFTFNAFFENTYLLWDSEDKEATLVDPGCSTVKECRELDDFIANRELDLVQLVYTHCHIDHILGNAHVCRTYGLLPRYHEKEAVMMERAPVIADMYAISYEEGPHCTDFIEEGETIRMGREEFIALWCPGHSPGSLVFTAEGKLALGGDVLFYQGIGRYDLPGCNEQDLYRSIREKLYTLDEKTVVYPGHGEKTSIEHEKKYNPFVSVD